MSNRSWFDRFSETTIFISYMLLAPFVAFVRGLEYVVTIWVDYTDNLYKTKQARKQLKNYDYE